MGANEPAWVSQASAAEGNAVTGGQPWLLDGRTGEAVTAECEWGPSSDITSEDPCRVVRGQVMVPDLLLGQEWLWGRGSCNALRARCGPASPLRQLSADRGTGGPGPKGVSGPAAGSGQSCRSPRGSRPPAPSPGCWELFAQLDRRVGPESAQGTEQRRK